MAETAEEEKPKTFDSFGLDERLRKAISTANWSTPTLVQASFIPLALEGRDIVTKARTGSGKTGAFLIPIIHQILQSKNTTNLKPCIQAVIMAPTKELCAQIVKHAQMLCQYCQRDITVVDLAVHTDKATETLLLSSLPDIVVCTPGRLVAHLQSGDSLLSDVRFVVIDEADLLYSFGYQSDVLAIVKHLPARQYQTLLTSATMSDDIDQLKKDMKIKKAANLKLEEGQLPSAAQLTQYHVRLEEEDKFVLLYALLKLKLIDGKTIVFVKDTDRCYQLRLFLGQFGISSCVLNAEMPANSRLHIVQQLNDGVYDFVIASDDTTLVESRAPPPMETADEDDDEKPTDSKDETLPAAKKSKPKQHRKRDKESGVARGVDFNKIANVINFDFPISVDDYVHRVGRTARGNNRGTALSFHTVNDQRVLEQVQEVLTKDLGCGDALRPYEFKMDELDGFRYRTRDVLRSVTGTAIREARLGEIRAELLKSKKLDTYFKSNPHELESIRHDGVRHTIKRQAHLGAVPEYIVPTALRGTVMLDDQPTKKAKPEKRRKSDSSVAKHKFLAKRRDPLQNFDCLDDDDDL